jgi:hypothetical protein
MKDKKYQRLNLDPFAYIRVQLESATEEDLLAIQEHTSTFRNYYIRPILDQVENLKEAQGLLKKVGFWGINSNFRDSCYC